MSYVWFAWATTILYGLSAILGKISSKHQIANPWLFNFFWSLLVFIFIIPFAVTAGFGWPHDWVSMVILSFTNATSGILYVLCLYRMDLSVLAPFYSLRTPLVALLGVLLFHEVLSTMQIFLIGIIFVAGMFVSVDERMSTKSFFNRTIILALFTMLNSAFFNVAIKYALLHNGFGEVVFWSNLLGFLFILPTIPLFISDLKSVKVVRYQGVAWSTALATLALLASYKALGNNVSISIVIMAIPTSMVFAILLSFFFPKLLEKHTVKVYAIRLLAAAVMVGAALGLSK
jgi:drug/metabolite transporter (DMT)-like permease